MMKKVLTLSLCALMATAASAQNAYLETGFDEGMPSAFTLHDEDGRTPSIDMANLGFEVGKAWIVANGVDPTDATNNVAISTSWYKNAGASNDWMVTPAITIADSKAIVRWRSMARDKDFRDGFKVYVSTTGTAVNDFTDAPLLTVSKEANKWTEHELSLADYVGKTIYIAFVNDSKDKAALYLDDLFVGVPSHVTMSLNLPRVFDGCDEIPLTGTVQAVNEEVNGFTIGFQSGNQQFEQTFSDRIEAGQSLAFRLDEPFRLARNATANWTAWVKSGTDSVAQSGRTSAYLWKVVAEEVTGTWCGYCVRGIGAMNYMSENYPQGFIGIAIHNNGSPQVPDSMAIPGEEYLNALFDHMGTAGYPHAGVNRNAMYWDDPANIPSIYNYIKGTPQNTVGLQLTASYDELTNQISSDVDVYFAADNDKAKYNLAYVVVENNVHRTHAETGILNNYCGYDQVNYYAGGSMGEMYGFENLPSIVNADDMWFQDVARGIAPDYEGVENAFGVESVKEGDHLAYSYSLDMPETVLKKENTELVVLLLNEDGIIVNADKCAINGTAPDNIAAASNRTSAEADPYYYTLNGVRVEKPTKGVYIHQGRKVIF